MTGMPHLAAMAWDHADRLQHCDLGGGGEVWFVYDASGARVRKVQRNASGSRVRERVYLGEFELYRERAANDVAPELERQTLHVGDGTRRLCLVETLTVDDGEPVAAPVIVPRFQHGNHLDSASLELDGDAAVISYEEFHPFGTTSYAANDGAVEVSAKRYRYIGKERDEETGLYHLGARYYAAWLGRWTAADPIGMAGGINLYEYARSNPVTMSDPSGMAPPQQPQEIRILRPEELAQDRAIEIGPRGKVEFRDFTPAEIQQGRAEVERRNRDFREGIYESLANPRETPRQRERRQRNAAIKAKQEAGEPLFPAQGTGQAPGRPANTDAYGNYSPYLQAVNETRALYGPDAGPGPGGPTDPLINPIVQQGGPAGDKVFAAFIGAALRKGGFLSGPGKPEPAPVSPAQTQGALPGPAAAEGGVDAAASALPKGPIQVTPQGVALPAGGKYQIPARYVENPHRAGSYGEVVDGKFVERIRIDPPTPPGTKGPNYSHYHLDGRGQHYSPRPSDRDPGFSP
ncbi:MAG: RHS repeat-associated core domain-containing protein [Deltaproteobacteria bacterium]|nr:RHS repeat-associated core domain-containing protein [Deltaproteobacteria bacterium]